MTAFGQHSMVPPLYANRALVAARARTACEAPSKLCSIFCFHIRNIYCKSLSIASSLNVVVVITTSVSI